MKTAFALLVMMLSVCVLQAQDGLPRYEIGNPELITLYVDPQRGSDSSAGTDPAAPLQSVDAAWRMIPMGEELQQGYRLLLAAGEYPAENLPTYWESRYGTYAAPIVIESAEGAESVRLANVNLFDLRYVYFINLTFDSGADAFHCERCDHVLLRGSVLRGADPESYAVQETFKANQSQHIYLEDNDISGAWDNAVDMVAVQYGHVIGNRIHQAGDWCMYLKGGSGYFRVEGNQFYDCGTGGFSAGQGTGFQYMVEPWIEYEAYFVSFVNNLIYDTSGAGIGVQGGYNIVMAHNTIIRTGERSHILEVVYGLRSCDGEAGDETRLRCEQYQQAGGWGNALPFSEENSVRIPSRHVYIVNNLFYNPAPYRSAYQHFTIFGAYTSDVQAQSAVAIATTDADLRIAGNLIWNGDAGMPLGIEEGAGCADSNPTCNAAQLLADNLINTLEPALVNVAQNDFSPTAALQAVPIVAVPSFDLSDVPAGVPLPETPLPVMLDWSGSMRDVPMVGALGG